MTHEQQISIFFYFWTQTWYGLDYEVIIQLEIKYEQNWFGFIAGDRELFKIVERPILSTFNELIALSI